MKNYKIEVMNLDKKDRLSQLASSYANSLVVGFARLLDNELTASQYFILQMLADDEMRTCSEIAGTLGVTLPAVSNLTNKLVKKGHAERVPSQTDRRIVYLKITDEGRDVTTKMLERYKELTDGLWTDFSEQEVDLLIASYEKTIRRLQQRNFQ
ncbi:MarR family winged helix-turn-helix transcriptional regulator [Paenibacillus dakarensis]|uniref:MarR family winged helix-turn-helix transcriptional regulator n=1 Tax=Paenibacillus dakarensis TaxID=1527293 RepID=UPI000AF87FDB|nr:MarR family transcriptional regulator [Paenibacillus dakarensis]